jgi:hypothetical protein
MATTMEEYEWIDGILMTTTTIKMNGLIGDDPIENNCFYKLVASYDSMASEANSSILG